MDSREALFWSKVDKTGECWLWTGYVDKKGYGTFGIGGRKIKKAHRYSYELKHGPIPDGLVLDHKCRTRNCVNPDHLEPVTSKENTNRGRNTNREKTHCKHGHPLSGDNLYVCPRGRRECRVCRRQAFLNLQQRRSNIG